MFLRTAVTIATLLRLPPGLAKCTNFVLQPPGPIDPPGHVGSAIALSKGFTCDGTLGREKCFISFLPASATPVGGVVSINATLNISVATDVADELFPIILPNVTHWYNPYQLNISLATDNPFNFLTNTTAGALMPGLIESDNATFGINIDAGTSGWVEYLPYMECFNGTLSGCSGNGFPPDGTAIQACNLEPYGDPQCRSKGKVQYGCDGGGRIFWHNSTKEEADAVYCDACERAQTATKDETKQLNVAAAGYGSMANGLLVALLVVSTVTAVW